MTDSIHIPGLDDDESATLNHLLDQLDQKAARNRLRRRFYEGKDVAERYGSSIPPEYYRLGIVLGWSAKAVDTLANRCNLDTFTWADGDLESLGLSQVMEDNLFGVESASASISSLLFGISFLINTEGDSSEPKSLIHVKDALSATGDWNSRTRRLDNLLSITGRDSEGNPNSLALYLNGVTLTAEKANGKWTLLDRSEHPWGVPAEPLVYKYRSGRPFGSSRISRTVMSLHRQALRTVIRLEGHADIYMSPDTWMFGAHELAFSNEDGTPREDMRTKQGRIRGVPDNPDGSEALARAELTQFAAASPQPHLDMLKQQAMLFSGETSIPLTSLGISDMSNPTSADSFVASREDLIAEAERATDGWSLGMRRAMIRALAIQNGLQSVPDEWKTINTKWRKPVHLSRAAEADAGSKQVAAAPWLAETDVGLELIGLSDDQIRRAKAERRRAGVAALTARLSQAPTAPTPAAAPAIEAA